MWWDEKLYKRAGVGAGDAVDVAWDLSATLGGTITGLAAQRVPEPASLALLLTALGGLVVTRRKT